MGYFVNDNANEIANSEDPDQSAPLGIVTCRSALFAQTYLSENLGLLQYAPMLLNVLANLVVL